MENCSKLFIFSKEIIEKVTFATIIKIFDNSIFINSDIQNKNTFNDKKVNVAITITCRQEEEEHITRTNTLSASSIYRIDGNIETIPGSFTFFKKNKKNNVQFSYTEKIPFNVSIDDTLENSIRTLPGNNTILIGNIKIHVIHSVY